MRLSRLVDICDIFMRRLPWTAGCIENNGKGPFETAFFESPDFASIHSTVTNVHCDGEVADRYLSTCILLQYRLRRNQSSECGNPALFEFLLGG